tara:strand:- start:1137 stop:1724 length:588 start_codon:yes stop_codon:yes gene_type:complete
MHLFFSTPVWTSKIDNFDLVNKEILEYILSLQKSDPNGVVKSNFHGWHSNDFNLKDNAPKKFISSLMVGINIALNDMNWDLEKQEVKITNMWAIINERGAFNQKHHHGNSDISAAYYVNAYENCGDISFYDPRPAPVFKHPLSKSANLLNASVNSIKPEEGMLVLFPSYVEHSVSPNLSNKKRVVISFNLSLIHK